MQLSLPYEGFIVSQQFSKHDGVAAGGTENNLFYSSISSQMYEDDISTHEFINTPQKKCVLACSAGGWLGNFLFIPLHSSWQPENISGLLVSL